MATSTASHLDSDDESTGRVEEDIIDGFAFVSFVELDHLQDYVSRTKEKKVSAKKSSRLENNLTVNESGHPSWVNASNQSAFCSSKLSTHVSSDELDHADDAQARILPEDKFPSSNSDDFLEHPMTDSEFLWTLTMRCQSDLQRTDSVETLVFEVSPRLEPGSLSDTDDQTSLDSPKLPISLKLVDSTKTSDLPTSSDSPEFCNSRESPVSQKLLNSQKLLDSPKLLNSPKLLSCSLTLSGFSKSSDSTPKYSDSTELSSSPKLSDCLNLSNDSLKLSDSQNSQAVINEISKKEDVKHKPLTTNVFDFIDSVSKMAGEEKLYGCLSPRTTLGNKSEHCDISSKTADKSKNNIVMLKAALSCPSENLPLQNSPIRAVALKRHAEELPGYRKRIALDLNNDQKPTLYSVGSLSPKCEATVKQEIECFTPSEEVKLSNTPSANEANASCHMAVDNTSCIELAQINELNEVKVDARRVQCSVASRPPSRHACSPVSLKSAVRNPSRTDDSSRIPVPEKPCVSETKAIGKVKESSAAKSSPFIQHKEVKRNMSSPLSTRNCNFQTNDGMPTRVPAAHIPTLHPYNSHYDWSLSYPIPQVGLSSSQGSMFGLSQHSASLPPQHLTKNPMGFPSMFVPDVMMSLSAAVANQEMLTRVQQELNTRFLQEHGILPIAPFTLHAEMHQHQHLHHHQHLLPGGLPGGYVPPLQPTPFAMPDFSTNPFLLGKPPSLAESVSNKLLHPSFHFPDQTEYDGLAKISSYPSFAGMQNLTSGIQFGSGQHGAFQSKLVHPAAAASVSRTPASQLLHSFGNRDQLALSMLANKKRGHWCSAHVKTAYFIRHLKQTRQESRNDTDSLNPPSGHFDRQNDVIQPLSRPGSFHLMDGPNSREYSRDGHLAYFDPIQSRHLDHRLKSPSLAWKHPSEQLSWMRSEQQKTRQSPLTVDDRQMEKDSREGLYLHQRSRSKEGSHFRPPKSSSRPKESSSTQQYSHNKQKSPMNSEARNSHVVNTESRNSHAMNSEGRNSHVMNHEGRNSHAKNSELRNSHMMNTESRNSRALNSEERNFESRNSHVTNSEGRNSEARNSHSRNSHARNFHTRNSETRNSNAMHSEVRNGRSSSRESGHDSSRAINSEARSSHTMNGRSSTQESGRDSSHHSKSNGKESDEDCTIVSVTPRHAVSTTDKNVSASSERLHSTSSVSVHDLNLHKMANYHSQMFPGSQSQMFPGSQPFSSQLSSLSPLQWTIDRELAEKERYLLLEMKQRQAFLSARPPDAFHRGFHSKPLMDIDKFYMSNLGQPPPLIHLGRNFDPLDGFHFNNSNPFKAPFNHMTSLLHDSAGQHLDLSNPNFPFR